MKGLLLQDYRYRKKRQLVYSVNLPRHPGDDCAFINRYRQSIFNLYYKSSHAITTFKHTVFSLSWTERYLPTGRQVRKSFEGLCGLVTNEMHQAVISGKLGKVKSADFRFFSPNSIKSYNLSNKINLMKSRPRRMPVFV